MEIQENKLVDQYKRIEHVDSSQMAIQEVRKYFQGSSWIYAIFDFAVAFGVYEKGEFYICLGEENQPRPLEWKYLRELRVFNNEKELLLIPSKGVWTGRLRGRMPGGVIPDEGSEEYFIEEEQKIWGRVKGKKVKNRLGFSKLVSDRGTRIWVPLCMEEEGAAAIRVRKYMRVPTSEHQELVYQTDIRMVGFGLMKTIKIGGGQENE